MDPSCFFPRFALFAMALPWTHASRGAPTQGAPLIRSPLIPGPFRQLPLDACGGPRGALALPFDPPAPEPFRTTPDPWLTLLVA